MIVTSRSERRDFAVLVTIDADDSVCVQNLVQSARGLERDDLTYFEFFNLALIERVCDEHVTGVERRLH